MQTVENSSFPLFIQTQIIYCRPLQVDLPLRLARDGMTSGPYRS